MVYSGKYIFNRLTKPSILIFVFFTSFFLMTKAEETKFQSILVNNNNTILHEQNLKNKLLETLTSLTCFSEEGISSYYGTQFHGRKTSSGQKYSKNNFTAAHRTLPFGTILKITNIKNSRSSLAIVNDRGPFVRKRIVDISKVVASHIGSSGIPSVLLSGFSNKEFSDSAAFANKYIAFPLIKDVQFADLTDINFLKQTNDFSESVELIHQLQDLNPNVPYCLVVSANEYFSTKFKRTYYVGILIDSRELANK